MDRVARSSRRYVCTVLCVRRCEERAGGQRAVGSASALKNLCVILSNLQSAFPMPVGFLAPRSRLGNGQAQG